MFKNRAVLFVVLSFGIIACGDDESSNEGNNTNNEPQTLEVVGDWETNFGFDEAITETTWGSYQSVVFYDNVVNVAVTQNFDDADFDPSLFNRIVWTEIQNNEFHYCTVTFGLETLELARDSDTTANAEDLDGEGCNGFPWTKMTRK